MCDKHKSKQGGTTAGHRGSPWQPNTTVMCTMTCAPWEDGEDVPLVSPGRRIPLIRLAVFVISQALVAAPLQLRRRAAMCLPSSVRGSGRSGGFLQLP